MGTGIALLAGAALGAGASYYQGKQISKEAKKQQQAQDIAFAREQQELLKKGPDATDISGSGDSERKRRQNALRAGQASMLRAGKQGLLDTAPTANNSLFASGTKQRLGD